MLGWGSGDPGSILGFIPSLCEGPLMASSSNVPVPVSG